MSKKLHKKKKNIKPIKILGNMAIVSVRLQEYYKYRNIIDGSKF